MAKNKQELLVATNQSRQFYKQAKVSHKGMGKSKNLDAMFYKECNQLQLLPKPVFKCIEGRVLRQQGGSFAHGYAEAL
jgi:hypothetical protein